MKEHNIAATGSECYGGSTLSICQTTSGRPDRRTRLAVCDLDEKPRHRDE